MPRPGQQPVKIQKILVPLDFSEHGKPALRYAKYLARLNNAALLFVHVTDCLDYGAGFTYIPVDIPKLHAQLREKFLALKNRDFRGFQTDFIIREGIAFEEIIDASQREKADLIVMATHGYTGLRHIFMGSTAERTIRYSTCPVMVIRSKVSEKRKERKAGFRMAE